MQTGGLIGIQLDKYVRYIGVRMYYVCMYTQVSYEYTYSILSIL
jgi:hypothetical protein